MSNHFTYEIDERNLRRQLNDHALPYKEEAWHNFERYTSAQNTFKRENRMKSLNVTLSRNVVLPVVFGVIVILFSFLLVNFISIKNPKAADQKVEANIVPTLHQSAVTESKSSEKATSPVIEQKQTTEPIPVVSAADKKTSPSQQIPAPAQNAVAASVNPPVQSSSSDTGITAGSEVKTEPVVKKKRKRPASEVVESEVLPEIRPTLVTEEREPDIRPN